MNKGLEVIEARWLFDFPPEQVAVIVHPQSIVHSMVEYVDGSVFAQLGIPDMTIPISYILAYPERLPLTHLPSLDLAAAQQLTFVPPDFGKFPCLQLAYEALARGDTCPAVLNAANEVTVESFLAEQIRFTDIAALKNRVLDAHTPQPVRDLGRSYCGGSLGTGTGACVPEPTCNAERGISLKVIGEKEGKCGTNHRIVALRFNLPLGSLTDAYVYCRQITRKSSSNFYFAFRLLPAERHNALCALYAFCRFMDDIADQPTIGASSLQGRERKNNLRYY